MIWEQLVNALSQGAFYAIFAAGLTLIFGVLHILNMAHGAIFMWGAFTSWLIISRLEIPFVIALPLAVIFSGLMGVVLDRIAFAPLRKRNTSFLPPLVSSLAFSIILVNLAEKVFGTRVVRYPQEMVPLQVTYELAGIKFSALQLLLLVVALVIMAGLWILVTKTKLGRQIRAIEESPRIASLLGVDVETTLGKMFFVAAGLAGAAGVFIGVAYNAVSPYIGMWVDLKGFAIIVLGGMGSIPGAVVGGFILGFAEIATVTFLSSDYRDGVAFIILILILIFKPSGLMGSSREVRS